MRRVFSIIFPIILSQVTIRILAFLFPWCILFLKPVFSFIQKHDVEFPSLVILLTFSLLFLTALDLFFRWRKSVRLLSDAKYRELDLQRQLDNDYRRHLEYSCLGYWIDLRNYKFVCPKCLCKCPPPSFPPYLSKIESLNSFELTCPICSYSVPIDEKPLNHSSKPRIAAGGRHLPPRN